LKSWLDKLSDPGIRISDPTHVEVEAQRGVKLLSCVAGELREQSTRCRDHTGDSRGQGPSPAAAGPGAARAEIGHEAIVPHHQFMELATRRNVLILKAPSLPFGPSTQNGEVHVIVNGANTSLAPEKKREIVANP
jgi:hypothetical protein